MDHGEELEALTLARPSLEDVYLDLVGEQELTPDETADAERGGAGTTHTKVAR